MEELGIRLEVAGNLRIWEASPVFKHQKEIDRIRELITKNEKMNSDYQCVNVADVYVQFPDGSLKRPTSRFFAANLKNWKKPSNKFPLP